MLLLGRSRSVLDVRSAHLSPRFFRRGLILRPLPARLLVQRRFFAQAVSFGCGRLETVILRTVKPKRAEALPPEQVKRLPRLLGSERQWLRIWWLLRCLRRTVPPPLS